MGEVGPAGKDFGPRGRENQGVLYTPLVGISVPMPNGFGKGENIRRGRMARDAKHIMQPLRKLSSSPSGKVSRKRKCLGDITNRTQRANVKVARRTWRASSSGGKLEKRAAAGKENPTTGGDPNVKGALSVHKACKVTLSPPISALPKSSARDAALLSHQAGVLSVAFGFLSWHDRIRCSRVCRAWHKQLSTTKLLQEASRADERWERYWSSKNRQKPCRSIAEVQDEITFKMRAILFDWMFQVSAEFDNHMDTTFLAMSLVDQVLNTVKVERTELQLVGIAGVLVASKMLETQYPDLDELLFLCDHLYNHNQLLKMELYLFQTVNFCPRLATCYTFLKFLVSEFSIRGPWETLAYFLAESSVLWTSFAGAFHDQTAAAIAVICLGRSGAPKHVVDEVLECSRTKSEVIIGTLSRIKAAIVSQRLVGFYYVHDKYLAGDEKLKVVVRSIDATIDGLIQTFKLKTIRESNAVYTSLMTRVARADEQLNTTECQQLASQESRQLVANQPGTLDFGASVLSPAGP